MKEINQSEFQEAVKEGFTLVDVYGDNCGPCVMLAKILEVLEKENPFVNIVKINADSNREFAEEFDIQGVPTILFMYDGKEEDRRLGAISVDEIMKVAAEYLY